MTGREPSLAHPLCTCAVEVLSLTSLIGMANPEWTGMKYRRTVTTESREACAMHGDHAPLPADNDDEVAS